MEKTIHFRQVEWLGRQENLPTLIHAVLATRPNVDDTTFVRDGETFQVRHRDGTPAEMRLHLASHVAGARKAITPLDGTATAADLGEAAPPTNSEFTEREIVLVVRQEKLGYVTGGALTQSSKVQSALRGLISLGHDVAIANRLFLTARANAETIAALMADGVDRLDLGLTLPSAEADEIIDGQPVSIVEGIGRAVGREITTRLTTDHDGEAIDALEDMSASLRLKLKKRKPTLEQIQTLTAIATQAVEDDDEGFKIRTVNGVEFTKDKLMLKSSFNHPKSTTLRYLLAWPAIVQFLDQT